MTGEKLKEKYTELNHPCVIMHVYFQDHDRYYPCIVLDFISGIKPGLVVWDGDDIHIVDASMIGESLEDGCRYLLATDDILAYFMDEITLGRPL